MSRIDWACLGAMILGFILFIYGSNVYDAVTGWTGVFLGIGAIAAEVIRYAYKELTKTGQPQPQTQNP
jgi:hypothetical protein